MDIPAAADPNAAPKTEAPPTAEKKPAKKKRGPYKRRNKNRARDERRAQRPQKSKVEKDPFADDARHEAAPETVHAAADDADAPREVAPDAVVSADEIPPLGIEGARAFAPMYYGALNIATTLLIAKAPAYKNNPAEGRRVAKAVELDPRGHYVGDVLTDASNDRHAIDPALIPVMAKLRLTPEWALLIVTAGVLFTKYAAATGDPDIEAAVSALSTPPAA
jgi:hypothetical protein